MSLALEYASAYAQSPSVWSDVILCVGCFVALRKARRGW